MAAVAALLVVTVVLVAGRMAWDAVSAPDIAAVMTGGGSPPRGLQANDSIAGIEAEEGEAGSSGSPPAGAPSPYLSDGSAPTAPPATDDSAPGDQSARDSIVVHVEGQVRRPGLVMLPPGARVADAVAAAGGLLPSVADPGVNLARVVSDGEWLGVGERASSPPPPGQPSAAGEAASEGSGLVSLNDADAGQLQQLPGVGPVLAQRIISYREEFGGFTDVSQLQEVSGIGPARFADLEPRLEL